MIRVPAPHGLVGRVRAGEPTPVARLTGRIRAHLSKSQVRELWDAGSFLVQEYGILLNTRIVIAHERLSTGEVRDGAGLVSDLVHQLGMALRRSAPKTCPRFHWLYVHNRGTKSGFSTTIVAFIPEELSDEAEEWLFDHFLLNRFGSSLPKDAVRMRSHPLPNRRATRSPTLSAHANALPEPEP